MSAKHFQGFRLGVRWLAAAGLIALLAPAARADEGGPACELERTTPAGLISIMKPARTDGEALFALEFASADDSAASFAFFGLAQSPLSRAGIPGFLDNLMVTLRFGDARQVDAPLLIYYTRDTIPIDIAPAKLWYPGYGADTEGFEILVSLGDLERHMTWGAGEEPATVLSWIAKRVGTGYEDDDVVGSGEIPLAPIRAARAAMGAALEKVVTAQESGGC